MQVLAIGAVWIILFVIGLAFLIPGIVGTILTSKFPHSPKVLRVFSILFMIFGILLCVLPLLILMIGFVVNSL